MKPSTGIQKRAARRNRNTSTVDLNLVSLIDIFTILIFFLLINTGVADVLPRLEVDASCRSRPPRSCRARPSSSLVSQNDIVVEGRKVAAAVSD